MNIIIMNKLFLLNIVYFIIVYQVICIENNIYYDERNICSNFRDKLSCNKEPGCGWCNNESWHGIYKCIQMNDDIDCIERVAVDCVRSTRCYYCIFNIYAHNFCFKSLFSPNKIYKYYENPGCPI